MSKNKHKLPHPKTKAQMRARAKHIKGRLGNENTNYVQGI